MYYCRSCCRPCNGIRLWLRKQLVCQEILAVATAVIFPLKKLLSAVEVVVQNWTGVWERGKAGSSYDRKMGALKAFIFFMFNYISSILPLCGLLGDQLEFIVTTDSGYMQLMYTNWRKNTKHQTFDNVKLRSQVLKRKSKLQSLQADRIESHCTNAVCRANCAAWELGYLLPMETVQSGNMLSSQRNAIILWMHTVLWNSTEEEKKSPACFVIVFLGLTKVKKTMKMIEIPKRHTFYTWDVILR